MSGELTTTLILMEAIRKSHPINEIIVIPFHFYFSKYGEF